MTWPPAPDAPLDSHIRAFFDDMADHPDDPDVRFVFADWLAERDDPRAEVLRLQGEFCQAIASKEDIGPLRLRVRTWEVRYAAQWFGEKSPAGLFLADSLLDVSGNNIDRILHEEGLAGLRQALREGWIRAYWLGWMNETQMQAAGKLELFAGPSELHFLGFAVPEKTLQLLSDLPRLRGLLFTTYGNFLTAGFGHSSGLSELRRLSLIHCSDIDDNALRYLRSFRFLEVVSLRGCTAVTSTGLAPLADLPALRDLDVSGCRLLDDTAMAYLAMLTGLRSLSLSGCSDITDLRISRLVNLTALESLDLSGCPRLTWTGVASLRGLTHLKYLNLIGVKLKPHETRALRKALPGCEVVRK
jgi:uncharacterized protein (TIGR02996 family)